MSGLIDRNRGADGKVLIKFSQEPINTKPVESANYFPTEQHARKELEYLKLRALAHAFKLDDESNMWFYLSLKLAQLRYPEPKKAGRKIKWDEQNRKLLLFELSKKIKPEEETRAINKACKQLVKIEPWITLLKNTDNPSEALRVQYYEAKKEATYD